MRPDLGSGWAEELLSGAGDRPVQSCGSAVRAPWGAGEAGTQTQGTNLAQLLRSQSSGQAGSAGVWPGAEGTPGTQGLCFCPRRNGGGGAGLSFRAHPGIWRETGLWVISLLMAQPGTAVLINVCSLQAPRRAVDFDENCCPGCAGGLRLPAGEEWVDTS